MTKKPSYKKLAGSIVIDLVGVASYLIPGIGESTDFAWAPISAYINYLMYKNTYISLANFGEEIGPFTDIIPTSTINWLYARFK